MCNSNNSFISESGGVVMEFPDDFISDLHNGKWKLKSIICPACNKSLLYDSRADGTNKTCDYCGAEIEIEED